MFEPYLPPVPNYRGEDKQHWWQYSNKHHSEIRIFVKGNRDVFRPPIPDEFYLMEWFNTYYETKLGILYNVFIFRVASDIEYLPLEGIGEDYINKLADWVIFYTTIVRGS